MNIPIPNDLEAWITAQVEGGEHESAGAYVAELIRRDRLSRADLDDLAALAAGEESGVSPRRVPDIMAALRAEVGGGR